MAMQLSEFTKGVVDKNKLDISSVTFSKDQRSFVFDYKGKQYSYNRLTDKLTLFEKKEENKESLELTYTWMNFSPNKKYILYAKNHNLYIKGNKALGVDTTEVQLTVDGMKDFSYARDDDYEPGEEERCLHWHVGARIIGIYMLYVMITVSYVTFGLLIL